RLDTERAAMVGDVPKPDDYLLDVDNPVVLPTDRKIRFHHTGGDVIHSWWVPELSVKKDAIPGYVNTNWAEIEEPGIYYGRCAELCGRGHGFMPVTVKAVPGDEYDEWLALKRDGDDDAAAELVDAYFTDNEETVADAR
ncbi:MAG: cytochrome c oxidase subunit II, partial [Guyparkeria sp.]